MALAALAVIYHRKMEEEEDTLQDEWGEAFLRYPQAVPRWLPRWIPYAHREGRWSWQGIAASKEWKTVLWVFVAMVVLYVREEWRQEHELFVGRHSIKHAVFIGLSILLMATDGILELIRYRAKRLAQARS